MSGKREEHEHHHDRDHDHHSHHHHGHGGHDGHGHTHGVIDPSIASSEQGIWAIKWSFAVLMLATVLQVVVVLLSGSVALLVAHIHNFGDAATAIPLGIAFVLVRLKPNKRFPFGYGRVEDLAGVAVVLAILVSAIVAGYETVQRFLHPQPISHLPAVALAAIIGFLGNEGAAFFRLKVGREIGSAALIADGYHARTDGWVSLSVLLGALGVWLGFPLADPIIGALITLAIIQIVWQSAQSVFTRMLDGVEPKVIDELTHAAGHVPEVQAVTDVRARWIGHRLHAELNIAVAPDLTVAEGHAIAKEVHHQLLHHLQFLDQATIHVVPADEAGEQYHQ